MDFRIGAEIADRDGDAVGKLRHVIVDPRTNEVVEIVLGESGLLGRDVLVPVGAVDSADHDRVTIQLAGDQLDKLQTFAVAEYITPPVGSSPAGALIAPGMAPVGAATGIETIGMMPIVNVTEQIPEGDVDLEPGTEVWATDGKIGRIRDVLVDDETRRVRGFVVEKGLIFHSDIEIDLSQVANIGADRVTLKMTKSELERSASST